MGNKQAYPASVRLKKRSEFLRVQQHGKKIRGLYSLCFFAPGNGRIGFSVTKRIGNAVKRNRVKRHLRESFRLAGELPISGCDFVIVPFANSNEVSFASWQQEMKNHLRVVCGSQP